MTYPIFFICEKKQLLIFKEFPHLGSVLGKKCCEHRDFAIFELEGIEKKVDLDLIQKDIELAWSKRLSCGLRPTDIDVRAAFFDMDATLIEEESMVLMAKDHGKEEIIGEITEKAMNGQLNFKQALHERLRILSGLKKSSIEKIAKKVTVRKGMNLLMEFLKNERSKSFIVSGGFEEFCRKLKKDYRFTGYHCNKFHFSKGHLTAKLDSKIVDAAEKSRFVKSTALSYGIPKEKVLVVGDGANDKLMMQHGGIKVGINPKQSLWSELDFAIFDQGWEILFFYLSARPRPRCGWVTKDQIYRDYHDQEWGKPVHDDKKHFEFLVLESAQAGLSWITVLKKREAYRRAFANFDPIKVSKFTSKDISRLLKNPGIIRNRAKIEAAINNAKCFLAVQKEFGTFDRYSWSFVKHKPIINSWPSLSHIPTRSIESDLFSLDLKKRGFKFLGTTTVYAHMQAIGMIQDHTPPCYLFPAYKESKEK